MKMSSVWQKLESKAGYPYFVNSESGVESPNHPEFAGLLESLQQYADIKYAAYRAAFKTYELQMKLEVHSIHASMGVLARHCLSISESSLTLEPCELEAVLADIYFASARERQLSDPVDDTQLQLLFHLIVNMYQPERNAPIRVQSVKVLLILLSDATCEEKWTALVDTCADHNGCVSARRLAVLLELLGCAAEFLDEATLGRQCVQADVDRCFNKSAGMLGMSTRAVVSWALSVDGGAHTRWLLALDRVRGSRVNSQPVSSDVCSACGGTLFQVLRFRCDKCCSVVVCEKCYLYDKDLSLLLTGHKKTHTLHEILDGEPLSPECLSTFMKDIKKLFSCSRRSKKKSHKSANPAVVTNREVDTCQTDSCKVGKGGMFTSTVGKAAGGGRSSPQALLQDIIAKLESQNKALKDLSGQLDGVDGVVDTKLRRKVDTHWGQIATQINRLKILKENLITSEEPTSPSKKHADGNRLQAFDLFSPIPMLQEETQPKLENMKTQPRLLSLDSGNFSDTSKPSHGSQQLMTMSGDAIKPVVVHAASDSISTVSMNDISTWYGNGTDTESVADRKRQSATFKRPEPVQLRSNSLCVTEKRYDADLQSVATSNHKIKELNADLDTVLDRLQQILTNNFVLDDSCFDNTQLRETANEMEGLLGTLIRGVEQRTSRKRVHLTSSV